MSTPQGDVQQLNKNVLDAASPSTANQQTRISPNAQTVPIQGGQRQQQRAGESAAAPGQRVVRPYQNYVQTIRDVYVGGSDLAATGGAFAQQGGFYNTGQSAYQQQHHHHHNHQPGCAHHNHNHNHNQQYTTHSEIVRPLPAREDSGNAPVVRTDARPSVFEKERASNNELLSEIQKYQKEIAQLKQRLSGQTTQELEIQELRAQLKVAVSELQAAVRSDTHLTNELHEAIRVRDLNAQRVEVANAQAEQYKASLEGVEVQLHRHVENVRNQFKSQVANLDAANRELDRVNIVLQRDLDEVRRRVAEQQQELVSLKADLQLKEQQLSNQKVSTVEKDREKIELLRSKDQEILKTLQDVKAQQAAEREVSAKRVKDLEEQVRAGVLEQARLNDHLQGVIKQLSEERQTANALRVNIVRLNEAAAAADEKYKADTQAQKAKYDVAVIEVKDNLENVNQSLRAQVEGLLQQVNDAKSVLESTVKDRETTNQKLVDAYKRLDEAHAVIADLKLALQTEQERKVEISTLQGKEVSALNRALENANRERDELVRRLTVRDQEISELQQAYQKQVQRADDIADELAAIQQAAARERDAANQKIQNLTDENRRANDHMFLITKDMVNAGSNAQQQQHASCLVHSVQVQPASTVAVHCCTKCGQGPHCHCKN